MNFLTGLTHSKETEILLMAWADHHPYLFTLIQVAAPINWVIVVIAGLNIAKSFFAVRGKAHAKGYYQR